MADKGTRTPSERVRAEVVEAAVAILEEFGPEGFTVRAIAQRAGVAPMAIYNHFGGVNGVLEALWLKGFAAFREALSVHTGDPGSDLFVGACRYRDFALAHRGLYTLMFMHRFRGFAPSYEAAQVAAVTFQNLVVMVERCQASGLVHRRASAADIAQAVWSACHGFVALEIQGMNFAPHPERAFTLLLANLRDGLRA
jgi:AcrR family transcriptional regulator